MKPPWICRRRAREHSEFGRRAAHPAKHSDARRHADLVIVYQHNHVFSNHSFSTIFTEGMANGWRPTVAAKVDAPADRCGSGHRRDARRAAAARRGDYRGRPIFYDLGNLIYNAPPTLTYIDEPMAWESMVAYVEFEGGEPS